MATSLEAVSSETSLPKAAAPHKNSTKSWSRQYRSKAAAQLYFKNLDPNFDEDEFQKLFEAFKCDHFDFFKTDGGSRTGDGKIIFYSSLPNAERAVIELNGRILNSRPLYVALVEKGRNSRLTAQQKQHQAAIRPQHIWNVLKVSLTP